MIISSTSLLRSQGYRLTPQRLAILHILQEANAHIAPIDIFERARRSLPGITEATVYRTLNFLVLHGLALAAHMGNGQLVYEIADRSHHHLICRACGMSQEIEHAPLEALYEQLQARTGFEIDSLHVTFFGLCPACRKPSLLVGHKD